MLATHQHLLPCPRHHLESAVAVFPLVRSLPSRPSFTAFPFSKRTCSILQRALSGHHPIRCIIIACTIWTDLMLWNPG